MFLTYYLVPRAQTRLSGVTDPNDSAKYRVLSWKNALTIAQANPVVGVGFNNYRYAQAEGGFFDFSDPTGGHAGSGADSSVLLVLATTGFTGLILFLASYFDIAVSLLSVYVKSKSLFALSVFISISALFIHSQFVNSVFYPQFLLWVAVLSGLFYPRKT